MRKMKWWQEVLIILGFSGLTAIFLVYCFLAPLIQF